MRHFAGIDVGTGSARAGIFDEDGNLLGRASQDIAIWREAGGFAEQSSSDIWNAVCASVAEAVRQAAIDPASIAGLGFDATCSLVLVGPDGNGVAAGPSEDDRRDIIMWMDHRAIGQAARINAAGHDVLRYVGGSISPEMQTPKLLWLKENKPATFARTAQFFDLPDWLTWRATGSLSRSMCSLVCKWTYLGHEGRWDESFFRTIGLDEFADEGFQRIGTNVQEIAAPVGKGLDERAAAELGLREGVAVGTSLIDAHAGGLGSLRADAQHEMALVAGTSACTMTVSTDPHFVKGVWGPYFSAMLPGLWLNEGGQSAYGAALDRILAMHPTFEQATNLAASQGLSLPEYLESRATERAGSTEAASRLGAGLNFVPEFLGNRAPDADPSATAILAGLKMDEGVDSLVDHYVATLRGLAYGTAEVFHAVVGEGQPLKRIVISGGMARSRLLRRILADATQIPVVVTSCHEPVLLGAAMLGVVASGAKADLPAASSSMVSQGEAVYPAKSDDLTLFHRRKREAYGLLKQCEHRLRAFHGESKDP